jgi:hypothetical protein
MIESSCRHDGSGSYRSAREDICNPLGRRSISCRTVGGHLSKHDVHMLSGSLRLIHPV